MKRKILITASLLIIVGIAYMALKPTPNKPTVHKPVQISKPQKVVYGIKPPYTLCSPIDGNSATGQLQQQEIVHTAAEMAKYNDVAGNVDNPDYQALVALHNEEIARYDSCEQVN